MYISVSVSCKSLPMAIVLVVMVERGWCGKSRAHFMDGQYIILLQTAIIFENLQSHI